ncbi:MAG: hypothetical protein RBT76_06480 [candidate division Zixibacteria bacterium]|nr:hypothetical protein [candidate division Zixibacteria bacterium]
MDYRNRIVGAHGHHWIARFVDRLGGREPRMARPNRCQETFVDESLPSGIFCMHSRGARLIARVRSGFGLAEYDRHDSAGRRTCPACGRLDWSEAVVARVLTVMFADGDSHEYVFPALDRKACYCMSETALHIYRHDTIISYSLELVEAVNFGTRVDAPEPAEVLAAERIIAGISR